MIDSIGNYHFEIAYAWWNAALHIVHSFDRTGRSLGYFKLPGAYGAWTIDASGLALVTTKEYVKFVESGGKIVNTVHIPNADSVASILVLSNDVIVVISDNRIHLLTPQP